MRPSRFAIAAVGALLAVVVTGCGLIQSSQRINIQNRTDVPVMLHVNDAWVGTFAPGATGQAPLAGLSYSVDVLSPSGAVLGSWFVGTEELEMISPEVGIFTEVVAPCGSVHLWIGEAPDPISRPSLKPEPCP